MESSDRRQSDVLPSINYGGFEQAQREGAHFRQRHPSMARTSISAASPVSPTTMFGPPPPLHSYQPPQSNGIHTPPESRRTSDDQPTGRQSLPSLHEVFDKAGSFSAPQTPPIGSGQFPPAPPSLPRTNSIPNSMPRSQPSEPSLHSSSQPPTTTPLGYVPTSQPPSHPPQIPPPPPVPHSHEPPYARHDSQPGNRTLPPNPYSQAQPPPTIPAMHPPETYQPPPPPPPPVPASGLPHHVHSPPYHPTPYPHQSSQPPAPHYPQPTAPFTNGAAPPPHGHQYPPYPPQPHAHQHHPPPPPQPSQSQHQPPYQPPHSQPSQYPYSQRDSSYQSDIHKGVKRSNGYGSTIERALSISTLRRDLDAIKEHSARIYHIVEQYQNLSANGQQPYPGGIHASLQEFTEALQRSQRNTDALLNCHQVFQELSQKEAVEHNSHKMSVGHVSDYGVDDGQQYHDDSRSNGSQQPEKKIRRGRAAPPGRCHSCHRAETPEWRRGPDGARTLCNACGLHYAKLTRKLNKNSAGPGTLAARKPPNSPLP